jgi:CubicO group peptidase (beta-lactamase class C family)
MKMDACFNWQAGCSANRRAQAVTLLRQNRDLAKDGPGSTDCVFNPASDGSCDISRYRLGRNGSAFGPQGGLRISGKDLARIGQVLLKRGKPLLSDTAYTEMTTPSWTFNHWIGHVGEAYSLRAGLWVDQTAGQGRIRYTTMVAEDAPVGHCLEVCP